METEYAFLVKSMSFYREWAAELEPFRKKYANTMLEEGVSFGVSAVYWVKFSKTPAEKQQVPAKRSK